jgi:predicted ArsR family transcriptional regulator
VTQQLELDMRTRARSSDPETSHDAAARSRSFAQGHYQQICQALTHGPQTIYEIADRTGLTHVQVARRTAEMNNVQIVRCDETRPSPSGRACHLWRLR